MTLFQGHPEIIASVPAGTQGMLPVRMGITQVPVGENHAFSIETEVAVNVVLLRKINPMNRVRKPLRAAAFPEKEDTLGLSPDSEKGYGESAASVAACSAGSWKRSVAHFEHVAGVLFLFLLVLVQCGAGFYEFLRTGCGRAVGYDIKVIDSNTVGAYPFEDMADGPDVKRRLAARDVEMVNMPDMPQT